MPTPSHVERSAPLRAAFNQHCALLFDPTTDFGTQREAVHALFALLSEIIGYDDQAPQTEQATDTYLPSGKAIAFQGAARCLWEFARTAKFLRGVEAALRQAQQQFPGERLRLLEAGCGPFALLALPLATRFSASEVCFTLLDIHPHSLTAARQIVAALGIDDYLADYIEADAATWRCAEEQRPHVIVSETMQNGLKNEPQVMITANLAPQRQAGGFFVPEAVQLEFAQQVFHTTSDDQNAVPIPELIRLAPLFTLRPEHAPLHTSGHFIIPEHTPARGQPVIATRIQVFGDIMLDDYECSLTLPIRCKGLSDSLPGTRIDYTYRSGPQPGLELKRNSG